MLNSEGSELEVKEEEMPKKKKRTEGRKRIYNPATGTFYRIRQRSSDKGARGTIMGKWKPPTETRKRKRRKK